ncbi:hypothetical protein Misp01_74900 [Microtetraspora sp. NBRC 13810]|nr:hypothetical protein Misp01_74900 [Microtetraspora sp. NBRC 13810]
MSRATGSPRADRARTSPPPEPGVISTRYARRATATSCTLPDSLSTALISASHRARPARSISARSRPVTRLDNTGGSAVAGAVSTSMTAGMVMPLDNLVPVTRHIALFQHPIRPMRTVKMYREISVPEA